MGYLGEKVFTVSKENSNQPSNLQDMPLDGFGIANEYLTADETVDHSEPSVSVTGVEVFNEVVENTISEKNPIKILMVKGEKGDPGTPGSAGDYETLINKPKINSNTLIGDKTLEQLGAQYLDRLTNSEIEALLT